MHSFVHHHKEMSEVQAGSTRGLVMNLGWRYDLMVWFFDIFLVRGQLRKLPQRAADLAQLQAGEAVLDVGCGTGTLAMEACKRVGATGRVCGIDPGPRQIIRARSKAERAGLSIDFQIGVIEHLAFPDHSFDVVLSTMMMHHLPDDLKRLGLSEIARVLKPEGRLVVVDFNRAETRQGQAARIGAGSVGLQDLPSLLTETGFSQIESGKIPFPRLMGFDAGFVKARGAQTGL
jgi:ubiquinone/menaquinone biosynthesis C-methylase UbiE